MCRKRSLYFVKGVAVVNKGNVYGNLVSELLSSISKVYWTKMYEYSKENKINHKDVNCFILNPESLAVYFGQNYIAIEYFGNPYQTDFEEISQCKIKVQDYTKEKLTTKQFIEKIVGFKYNGTSGVPMPLYTGKYEDLIIPTNAGINKLVELKWNFSAQNGIVSINSSGIAKDT